MKLATTRRLPQPINAGIRTGPCCLATPYGRRRSPVIHRVAGSSKGFQLSLLGDLLEVSLVAVLTLLTFQNMIRSHAQVRAFWLLLFVGAVMSLSSLLIWSTDELWFHLPVPDVPVADILLFVGLVPLVAPLPCSRKKCTMPGSALLGCWISPS